jgi:RNA polymerase sigma-70 factor (ECF subfamily)
MEDIECIKQTLNGDINAFRGLVVKYKDALYLHILRKVHNNITDTEDILNEVFIKAYSKLDSYKESTGGIYPWLLTIANNHIIDFARKKNRIPKGDDINYFNDIDPATKIASEDMTVEEFMIKSEDNKLVREVIEELPLFQANLINMYYYRDMSYEDMAKELGKPIGTIKTGLHRAKLKLSKLLENNKNIK